MRYRLIALVKHSSLMVKRNFRSYSLLSITILISFSVLSLFLSFMDSNIYNENKEVFSVPPNVIMLYGDESENDTIAIKYNALINQMSKMNDTHYFEYFQQQITLEQYGQINASINYVPSNMWGFFMHGDKCFSKVSMQDNTKFCLKKNEAIVDKELYNILKKTSKDEKIMINIPVYNNQDIAYYIQCNVIGACETSSKSKVSQDMAGNLNESVQVFVSQDTLKGENIKSTNHNMLIYSLEVPNILQSASNLNIACNSQYIYQQEAIEKIIVILREKYVILLAFIVILGINLYSCMKNVLYDRYFEIGVKRAIGIKKRKIVFQFFIEGIIVMVVNTFISILFSNSILILYKLVMLKLKRIQWTIYISKYSIISYGISCLLITLMVSVLLAYQAVNFEIVKYLKEE